MGLILDTDVLIRGEKQAAEIDFTCGVEHRENTSTATIASGITEAHTRDGQEV